MGLSGPPPSGHGVNLDHRAIGLGAAIGIAIGFPGLVLGGLLDNGVFAVLVIAGFVAAGTVAGAKRPDTPYTHGIVAGVATAVATQVVAVALLVAKDKPLHVAAHVFVLVLGAGFGLMGSFVNELRGSNQ